MEGIFQKALKDLTETQIEFLCKTFGIEKDALLSADEEYLDEIYDELCDMEVEESVNAGDKELSEDGKIVSDIVTTFGNAIAESEGYLDEEDFEKDLNSEE